jgi:hypothetical protein
MAAIVWTASVIQRKRKVQLRGNKKNSVLFVEIEPQDIIITLLLVKAVKVL